MVLLINVTIGIIYSWEDGGVAGSQPSCLTLVFLFAKEIFLLTSWKNLQGLPVLCEVILKGGKEFREGGREDTLML